MMNKTRNSKASEEFANMFQELEESGELTIEEIKVNIAEQIYLAMQEQDRSEAELARRLGCKPPYVNKILHGDTNFTIESLVKIGMALNLKLELRLVPKQTLTVTNVTNTHGANVIPAVFTSRREFHVTVDKDERNEHFAVAA
jgi:transcriptional regulator with XRE-family HTH domain